ncbi:hypothetical protein DICA4_E06854 [Diutina catenulata]
MKISSIALFATGSLAFATNYNPYSKVQCDLGHSINDDEAKNLINSIDDDRVFSGDPRHHCEGRACVSWSKDVEIRGEWLKTSIWQMQQFCLIKRVQSARQEVTIGGDTYHICLSDRPTKC